MEILNDIFAVFGEVGDYIVEAVNDISALFYTPAVDGVGGDLTLLGTLAVVGLAFSVVFLIMGIITNFLNLRS